MVEMLRVKTSLSTLCIMNNTEEKVFAPLALYGAKWPFSNKRGNFVTVYSNFNCHISGLSNEVYNVSEIPVVQKLPAVKVVVCNYVLLHKTDFFSYFQL